MAAQFVDQVATLERTFNDGQNLGSLNENIIQEALRRAQRFITEIHTRERDVVNSLGLSRWAQFVQILQNLAFIEPDSGGQSYVASWCERQWAEILQLHPENVAAMKGLGHYWLLKSQPVLSSIYSREDSPSSSEGSRKQRLGISRPQPSGAEDTSRVNSPDYVEARSLLRPALENLDKAIEEAERQGTLTGKLLELDAEAHMSFGNVSHPRNNETAYQKALKLLRRASELEDYVMDPYLEEFLDENIDYIQ